MIHFHSFCIIYVIFSQIVLKFFMSDIHKTTKLENPIRKTKDMMHFSSCRTGK